MEKVKITRGNGRWLCEFGYDPFLVNAIKRIGGSNWVARQKVWSIPATVDSWFSLHENFDSSNLLFDPKIRTWVNEQIALAEELISLSTADDAELTMLPELHPELYTYISSRGYQRADIAFMARALHPMNTNQPGTGKTVETIASIFEAGLDETPVLVVAPKTALAPVWLSEAFRWLSGMGVPIASVTGQGDPLQDVQRASQKGAACWLVANPEAIKQKQDGTSKYPWIYEVDWGVLVIDEFHRMGLGNSQTLAYSSFVKIKAEKRIALSGTPMGGKPIRLWSVLNFLYPDSFPSKWAFAGNWLNIYDNGFGKVIGDVKSHKQEDFSRMMAQYSTRRVKSEIMKWLPPKQYIDLYVDMDKKQKTQYQEWEANGEIEIEEEQLDALSILALYTRLRQFAGATQRVDKGQDSTLNLYPTEDSCKLPVLWGLLEERGIPDRASDASPVIVFSQFTRMINMVEQWLNKNGVATAKITGEVSSEKRSLEIERFQSGEVDVFLMNTNAGGVAITLDRADTVVFLDETWNPDDQEQAEDRAHRGSKETQVSIYRIITKESIEERIRKGNITKETINARVLDSRQK